MAEGQRYSLAQARADGWMERLLESSPDVQQLSEVLGGSFVAFSVIAGVRITSVTLDRSAPEASLVEFSVSESRETHTLAVNEFRRRLAEALVQGNRGAGREPLPEDPKPEDLQAFIGFRTVLLAPVFGLRLVELRLPAPAEIRIAFRSEHDEDDVLHDESLAAFEERVQRAVLQELERVQQATPFSLELERVDVAEQALTEGRWQDVVEQLGAWPGVLSVLLRTQQGAELSLSVRATLARGLGALAYAYAHLQRDDWADEVMRLGIQWAQDGPAAPVLFQRLGETYVLRARFGEAIGILRRAMSLGGDGRQILPLLAQCYAARERWVAAAVCLDEAEDRGSTARELGVLRRQVNPHLADAWPRFRAHVARSSTAGHVDTVVPPPIGA